MSMKKVLLAVALGQAMGLHAPPVQCDVLGLPKGGRKPSGVANARRESKKRRRVRA